MFSPAPQRAIEQVIYVDQTYYVPRVMISDHFIFWFRTFWTFPCHGLTFKDQLKALEMIEYQHLLQIVHAFVFNYDLKAGIEVLFTDIERVLKIDYVFKLPFKVQRGVRQCCSMPGKLHSRTLRLYLKRLCAEFWGVHLCDCRKVFKLSAGPSDTACLVRNLTLSSPWAAVRPKYPSMFLLGQVIF